MSSDPFSILRTCSCRPIRRERSPKLRSSTAAIKLGIGVLMPLTDGHRYDLVFDLGRPPVRVQCKWARLYGACRARPCVLEPADRAPGCSERPYSAGRSMRSPRTAPTSTACFYLPIERVGGPQQLSASRRAEPEQPGSRHELGRRLRVRAATIRASWGRSSAGRASDGIAKGQGFDPPRLHPRRRARDSGARPGRLQAQGRDGFEIARRHPGELRSTEVSCRRQPVPRSGTRLATQQMAGRLVLARDERRMASRRHRERHRRTGGADSRAARRVSGFEDSTPATRCGLFDLVEPARRRGTGSIPSAARVRPRGS